MFLTIQIHHGGAWRRLGQFEPVDDRQRDRGYLGRAHFSYDPDYVVEHLGAADHRAASCRYPVDFDLHSAEPWPAFMLDILPAGAARRALVASLDLANNATADWPLLAAAGHPPGNLRISAPEARSEPSAMPDGFSKRDVVGRDPAFIEYAYHHRAGVAGTSGAHGESPKFLLTEDEDGRLHADGVLSDDRARRHWLVKWPRGSRDSDRAVLRNEAAYLELARALGLRVHGTVFHDGDTLFVERFDRRVTPGGVERLGLESLCSLAGVAEYGARIPQQTLLEALVGVSSQPIADASELVVRDVLSVALGNTDNHARNSSVLKNLDGTVTLSPLYDFAPMFLDESGIARACRWTDAEHRGFPIWPEVVRQVETIAGDASRITADLLALKARFVTLPDELSACGADKALVERLSRRLADVERGLGELR